MAIVNKVDIKMKVDIDKTIQYQIMTYCFFNNIFISNSDMKFLAELSKYENIELTKFCHFRKILMFKLVGQYYWIIKYQVVNPKSHKELRKDIADEVGVHNSVVDEFITFYYSKLRRKLSDIDFPRIHVDGLGTFY